MSPRCPRLFEVEALRDGRLAGDERVRFERHLGGCAACAAEARALEELAGALRRAPGPAQDALHLRRERTRLLAAFNQSLLAERRLPRPALLAAAALAATLTVLAAWPSRPPGVVVEAEAGTSWSDQREGARERIVLEKGTLKLHVVHAPGAPRLQVSLPDGELEDTGTTFTVVVRDRQTVGVEVQEGSVVLRLRGRGPVSLVAGEHWSAKPRAEPAASADGAAPLACPAPAPAPEPVTPQPAALVRAAVKPDPSAEFRAAMAALNGGEYLAAAGRFARFEARHPHDGRVEDAAYLRILALERCDARAELEGAIADYLRRYPHGFRRAEVERLAR